jgi:hypothetical protein
LKVKTLVFFILFTTFFLGIPFLVLFPFFPLETKIENSEMLSKTEESFANYVSPIIDSFDFNELKKLGFASVQHFNDHKFKHSFKRTVDKQTKTELEIGFISASLFFNGGIMYLDSWKPRTIMLNFYKISHDEPWKLFENNLAIEDRLYTESLDPSIEVLPENVVKYIKSKFEIIDKLTLAIHLSFINSLQSPIDKKDQSIIDHISSVDFNNLPLDKFPYPCDISQGMFNSDSWDGCVDQIKNENRILMDQLVHPIPFPDPILLWDESDDRDKLIDKKSCKFTNGNVPDGIAYNKSEGKIYCGDSTEERFIPHRHLASIRPLYGTKNFSFKDHNQDGYMDVSILFAGSSCGGSGCGGQGEIILTKKSKDGKLERVLPNCDIKDGKEVFHDDSGKLLCASKVEESLEDYQRPIEVIQLNGWIPASSFMELQKADDAYQKKDYEEAIRLFRLSAEKGVPLAQFNLGFMYAKGQGVSKDYTLANMWWSICGPKLHDGCVKNRSIVEKEMYPNEFNKSLEMALKWKSKK